MQNGKIAAESRDRDHVISRFLTAGGEGDHSTNTTGQNDIFGIYDPIINLEYYRIGPGDITGISNF